MKQSFLSTSAHAVFFAVLLCCGAPATAPADSKIRIGVSTALTGEAATWGLDIQAVLRFANDTLTGGRYELVFEDDQCTSKGATSAAHKLVHIEKVPYVMGFACSATILASARIYQQAKVPMMVVSASSPRISELGEFVFRTFPSDALAARRLYDHLAAANLKTIGVISRQNDYAQDFKDRLLACNGAQRLDITTVDYLPDDRDYRTLLTRLRAKQVRGLFINSGWEEDFARVLKQVKAMGWAVPVFGAYFPSSPALRTLAGTDLEGVEFVDTPPLFDLLNPEGRKLYEKFTAAYGELRSNQALFAAAYESMRALHQAATSGSDVNAYLRSANFDGIFGPWSFDAHGDIRGFTFVMKKIAGGKPVLLTPPSPGLPYPSSPPRAPAR